MNKEVVFYRKENSIECYQANLFALYFTMPTKKLKNYIKQNGFDIYLIAAHFQVPVDKVKERIDLLNKNEKIKTNYDCEKG